MSITAITHPLPGERVLALSPGDAAEAASTWRRRPNLYPGRALTAPTLEARQEWSGGRVAARGQAFTPGVVRGLEVDVRIAPDPDGGRADVRLLVAAGQGLATSGEDVALARAVEIDFWALPVVAPPTLFSDTGEIRGPELRGRRIGPSLGELLAGDAEVPRAGILLAQPVLSERSEVDDTDPCDRCACGDGNVSYEDWRLADGVRFLWYAWPEDWRALPSPGALLRNQLAHTIFEGEQALAPGEELPWEAFGVPLAVVGVDGGFVPLFADRAAVVRRGGLARHLRLQHLAEGGYAVGPAEGVAERRLAPPAPLVVDPGEELFLWVRVDARRPPDWLGVEWVDADNRRQLAYWGPEPDAAAGVELPDGVRVDHVPAGGRWERLLVSAALLEADDGARRLTGVGFLVQGGAMRVASIGRVDAGGVEHDWFASGGRVLAGWRLPALWQARIEQLAEHLVALGEDAPVDVLAGSFDRLPPFGVLPRGAVDLSARRSGLFPDGFDIEAVPVPLEQLDLAVRESAGMATLDFGRRERVQVLVPVPQAAYEPRLLQREEIDPLFDDTLSRFLLDRARALAARWSLQNKRTLLVHAASGRFEPPPPIDEDPRALEPESLQGWGPPGGRGGQRLGPAAGLVERGFDRATTPLQVAQADRLYAWAYLDPENPPRSLMLEWHTATNATRRAYWGEDLIDRGRAGSAARLRIGDLPAAGRWVRLEVPEEALDLDEDSGRRRLVQGMGFLIHDGQAAFAGIGRIDREGIEREWFSEDMPPLEQPHAGEPWHLLSANDLLAPFEARLGVVPAPGGKEPGAGRSQTLAELESNKALAFLSARERAQLREKGVDGFIAYLKSRADRVDDITDYGFIKVQADVYRLRQLMLDTADATRLAVSPALAGIARAETATASQKQLAEYLKKAKLGTAVEEQLAGRSVDTGAAAPAAAGAGTRVAAAVPSSALLRVAVDAQPAFNVGAGQPLSTTAVAFGRDALVAQPATAFDATRVAGTATTVGAGLLGASGAGASATFNPGLSLLGTTVATGIGPLLAGTGQKAVVPEAHVVSGSVFEPRDVVLASPLVGKAFIRTVSIAERLAEPKAVEVRNYAAASRHEAVLGLLRLVDQFAEEDGDDPRGEGYQAPGMFDGVFVYGFRGDVFVDPGEPNQPGNSTARGALRRFVGADRAALLRGLMNPPERSQADEGGLFSDTTDMSDYTIALFRQLEGRVRMYRDAIAACEVALALLREQVRAVDARIGAWSTRLAEARHDVGVARALIDEELARLDAINARRARVLAEEVRFLAYRRPRTTGNLVAAPVRDLVPGLLDAPVPACLDEHDDAPEELAAILRVVREAPASWFGQGVRLIDGLGRIDLLLKTVQTAQLRSGIASVQTLAPPPPVATAAPVLKALAAIQTRQLTQVTAVHAASQQLDLSRLALGTVQGVREQASKVVSLGDLIDGGHGQGAVARRAADFLDTFGRIGACLHAGFSATPPALRLAWAEQLSEYDTAPSLRNLSALSGFATLSFAERRRLQTLVDWLFDQLTSNATAAADLVNDVVRMCLLLASHAPVGRIIAGRLPRPVIVKPGLSIPLLVLDAARLRVGMQATLFRGDEVVARAVVEDIGAQESIARVVHAQSSGLELGTDVRVQFTAPSAVLARIG